MRIIDLLDLIAKGEQTPNTIKIGIYKFYKCKKNNTYDDYDYQNEDGEYLMDYLSDYEYLTKYLFNEIEVIENAEIIEEEKEIEKLNQSAITLGMCRDKINELIDEINKLRRDKE